MINYELGKVVKCCDAEYVVEKLFTLTREEMRKFELYYPDRVRLQKINGVGPEIIECAINGGD